MAQFQQVQTPSNLGEPTVRSLDINSTMNQDVFGIYGIDPNSEPTITTIEILNEELTELLIRFDNAPEYYQKEDYADMVSMLYNSLKYIYKPESNKAVEFKGIATTSTNPTTETTLRYPGLYLASQSGTYTEFLNVSGVPINIASDDLIQSIIFLVPVVVDDAFIYYTTQRYRLSALLDETLEGDGTSSNKYRVVISQIADNMLHRSGNGLSVVLQHDQTLSGNADNVALTVRISSEGDSFTKNILSKRTDGLHAEETDPYYNFDKPNIALKDGSNSVINILTFITNPIVQPLLAGQFQYNPAEGTVVLGMNGGNVEQSLGLALYHRIKASLPITNGQLVMSDGTDGNSGVVKAKPATVGCDPKYILGIATESLLQNDLGFVTWFGKIRGLDTSVWAANSLLYQSETHSGGLQLTMPTAPYNKTPYAIVINQHASVGTIFVRVQRSLALNDLNDVDTTGVVTGQPLVKKSNGTWGVDDTITVETIDPKGTVLNITSNLEVQGDITTTETVNAGTIDATQILTDNITSVGGFKKTGYTNTDYLLANGGTISTVDLKAGIYELYKPDGSAVVVAINAAGQMVISGDIIHNGSSYETHAENINTPQNTIELRSGSTLGLAPGEYAGFVITKYDGTNDGLIVIDKDGVLRIGDVGDLQPVMTREESPVNQSPLFFNTTTKRAETLAGTIVKTTPIDADSIIIKDSADSNKPKWVTWANLKATLKTYFDTLYVALTGNQTVAGIKTFSSLPKVPLVPIADEDAASKAYADGQANAALTLAQKYAENPEDVEVVTGEYSAKHWAAKAQNSAESIEQSADMLIRHEAEIASLENTINSANINQETTATVSGVDTVALPKTAANTGMQVQMFGQSAQNLVVNGDFRNGTSGWTAGNSTNSVTNGILTNTANGTAPEPNAYSGIGNKIIGNKYYLRANVTTKSALCTKIRIGSLDIAQAINSPIVNNPYMLSGVITASTTYNFIVIYHLYASTADATGAAIEVDNVMAINLTATFGADNEPTKEQCDILFANYFEGSDNVLGTGRVRSVGKNLFDKTKAVNVVSVFSSYKYISPLIYVGTGTLITVSMTVKMASTVGNRFLYVVNSNNSLIGTQLEFTTTGLKQITRTANTNYIRIIASQYVADNSIEYNELLDILQIEKGTTATAYELHKPSILQLTTPELRSNGLIKDEIRKGTNGYELVKRVGVGTLGSELVLNGDFTSGTENWNFRSGWSLVENKARFNGTTYNFLGQTISITSGKFYRIAFTIESLNPVTITFSLGGLGIFSGVNTTNLQQSNYVFFGVASVTATDFRIYAEPNQDFFIDNISIKEVSTANGIATGNTATVVGTNIHYTLATPVITPIAHAGLLNSNSNGTAYFEPIIADAGVYSSNLAIQLTDYPISSFESIRKYANGTYTELNTSTAVIASGGLSFTHPNLTAGDLVMFTYAYANESIGRSMTLTYAISNSNPYYNVTNSVPLSTGYYTSTTARAAVPEGVRKTGLILTYETAAGVWYTERYIGTATDTTSFTNAANWEIGVLRIAAVTDTTEYAEITI